MARRLRPEERYARSVVSGKTVAGRLVRLACQRHLDDLKNAEARGFYFDGDAADHALQFFSMLRHFKGEWGRATPEHPEGQPFVLELWQQFYLGVLFGWLRLEDDLRRFRTTILEVARKNGKTQLAAGIALYLAFMDSEPGAEVYSAATKRDQAKIMFEAARQMVKRSAVLRKNLDVFSANISHRGSSSKFEPLGADSNQMDGLGPHGALIDELHAHKTRGVYDVLETGTGARRQSLLGSFTTAGIYNPESICWEIHDYGIKVLEGSLEDDTFFPFICSIDEGDDWADPANWPKGNPNLGVSVKPDQLERMCHKALASPQAQNAFRRLHCNEWTQQATRWIDMKRYASSGEPLPDLRGEWCFGGLDLARTMDISAFALWFPEQKAVLEFYWVPEDNIAGRSKNDRVPYDVWAEHEHIRTTPGEVTDFDFIRRDINQLAEDYDIREIAFDPRFADQLVTQLTNDGLEMVKLPQTWDNLAGPTEEVERLIVSGELSHGEDPVLRWMFSNAIVKESSEGYKKPDKAKSTEKIDGVVALVMAVGRAMRHEDGASAYDVGEGVFVV